MASGSFAPQWSKTYPTARWQFSWNSEKTNNLGETKVSWELKTVGRSTSPTWLETKCKLIINYTHNGEEKEIVDKTWYKDNEKEENSFNDKSRGNGSFLVSHNNEGKGSFKVTLTGFTYETGSETTSSTSFDLDNYLPLSKNFWDTDAKVSLDAVYIAPKGSFTVSWSGAKNGNGVKIEGYDVQYKIGDSGWVNAASPDKSPCVYQLALDEESRGKAFKVRVRAKSDISGYESDYKESGVSYINVKPEISSFFYNSLIVSYKAEEVKISCVPKQKPNQQVEVVCKYLIDDGNTYEEEFFEEDPAILFPVGKKHLYLRIAAYDSVEYGNWSEEIVFERNTNVWGDADSLVKINDYECSVSFPDEKSTAAEQNGYFGSVEYEILENKQSIKNDVFGFNNNEEFDVRCLPEKIKSESKYEIICTIKISDWIDSIECIKTWEFTAPKLILKADCENFEGKEQYFNKAFTPVFNNLDEEEKDYWQINETNKDIDEGSSFNEVEVTSNNFKFLMQASNWLTKIKTLDLDFEVGNNNSYNPYTDQLTLSALAKTNWNEYGLNNAPSLWFCFKESDNQASADYYPADLDSESNLDTLNYSLSKKDSYLIAQDFKETRFPKYIGYQYTTEFGTTMEYNSQTDLVLDFAVKPFLVSDSSHTYIRAEERPIQEWSYLLEGMELKLDEGFTIGAFSMPKIYVQYSINDSWITLNNSNNEIGKDSNTGNSEQYNCSYTKYTFNDFSVKIDYQIADSNNSQIRLKVVTDHINPLYLYETKPNTKEEEEKFEFSFKWHTEPIGEFTSVQYIKNTIVAEGKILYFGYNVQDEKISSQIDYCCSIQKENKELEDKELQVEDDKKDRFKCQYDYEMQSDYKYIALKLKTTLTTKTIGDNSKEYQSIKTTENLMLKYLICYNTIPTVAYRQNYLGINVVDPSSEDFKKPILIISAYNQDNDNGHKFLYLTSSDNTASIDLTSGAQNNFIIDCGTW